jgi:hypothetical protein
MCDTHLADDPDAPQCTRRDDGHTPHKGCTYVTGTGSDVDDRHTDGGHG